MRNGLLNRIFVPAFLITTAGIGCNSLLSEIDRIKQKAGSNPAAGSGGDASPNCSAPVLGNAEPVYAGSPNWLQYVRNDGNSTYEASGTACTGAESGLYNSCLHSGELRRVEVTNRTSCTGLVAEDALQAFHWRCILL